MKKFVSLLMIAAAMLLFLHPSAFAQKQFWGMTSRGGEGGGVIFQTDSNGNNQNVVYPFSIEFAGENPQYSDLCQAANGKLYGMTYQGGIFNMGVLFEYDAATGIYVKKIDFSGSTNGSSPRGSLMKASNGKLYGMTSRGGINDQGTMFEFDPATNIFTKKFDFSAINKGEYPFGSLVQAASGKLYGMTFQGGANNFGVLFEYDLSTGTFTKKLDFAAATNGSNPYGTLLNANNDKLYGMTYGGGSSDYGVLFEYDPATNTYLKLLDFDGTNNGRNPYGSLMQASNGKLYGLTSGGGTNWLGVLFEYDLTTSTYAKQFNFDGYVNGTGPYGTLVQAANNKLYGITNAGGTFDMGVVFEYDYTSSTFAKKFEFDGANAGSTPFGSMIRTTNDKLYGMTSEGGTSGWGVLFEYDANSNTFQKSFDFEKATNGKTPSGSLIKAINGKIYGMTSLGGTNNMGVIFEYNLSTLTITKKFDFDGATNGKDPRGSLIQATNGKIYGVTYAGGSNDDGVLFEYDAATNTYLKKLDFDSVISGQHPYEALLQATNGKLYGMTSLGGASNNGVLFEYNPATSTYTKKLDFDGINSGSRPNGSLMQALNGKIYGMTSQGGSSDMGVLFEFDPATNIYTKKLDFGGSAYGRNPTGSLIQGNDGKLYGMTYLGGTNDKGVLFEYDIATSTFEKELDFDGTTLGSYPEGSLLQAANGKLYGMTYSGGTSSLGVIFEYDITSTNFTKKLDFDAVNGKNPSFSNLIEIIGVPIGIAANAYPISFKAYPNPVTDNIYIELENNATAANFEIINSIGLQVCKGIVAGKTQVETSSLARGMYIIKINCGKTVECRKIIKE